MKKLLIFSLIAITVMVAACTKTTNLSHYTPPVTSNFSVTSLKHTADTVNVGDTVHVTASGIIYDTTKTVSVYLTVTYTAGSATGTFAYGSATTPIKITPVIGAVGANGTYAWTADIPLVGATAVAHKTKLTIAGNFIYQLSLSSEQGTLSATDAGIKNKTVYVQ
jgi:hypothetical protein